MILTGTLERRLRAVSQQALFSEVQQCLQDIVTPVLAEYVVTCRRLQEAAQTLDYEAIGDPRVESQHAA